ncbi:hypothetical protein WJS89_03570 [Sphingomicrobium sp. XHP0235]|uniref:hypothetical protein n=1 Tax=Sphingomicrobium aquimarinum TaxID=3133971 RepID=UPI0031FEDC24
MRLVSIAAGAMALAACGSASEEADAATTSVERDGAVTWPDASTPAPSPLHDAADILEPGEWELTAPGGQRARLTVERGNRWSGIDVGGHRRTGTIAMIEGKLCLTESNDDQLCFTRDATGWIIKDDRTPGARLQRKT